MDLSQIFNTMVFPCACCIAMGWYVKYITDHHRQELANLNERHDQAEKELSAAIANNTQVMERLCTMLEIRKEEEV